MNEPPIKKVLDYNTESVKPRFKLLNLLKEIDGYYSAFWPLIIVFLAFTVLLVYEVSYLRYRALVLNVQNAQFTDLEKKAKEQSDLIKSLHKDLDVLAPTHPDVAAILKDFFPEAPASSDSGAGSSPTPQK